MTTAGNNRNDNSSKRQQLTHTTGNKIKNSNSKQPMKTTARATATNNKQRIEAKQHYSRDGYPVSADAIYEQLTHDYSFKRTVSQF